MAQYINAEKLKAEIERRWKYDQGFATEEETKAYQSCCEDIFSYIDSLQQEQLEVDLDKEIKKIWDKCIPEDEGMGVEIANIHIESFDIIARHFYELGLKAGKEE